MKVISRLARICFVFLFISSAIFIFGCSDDLSRNKAKKIIMKQYPVDVVKKIPNVTNEEMGNFGLDEKWFKILDKNGVIKYTFHRGNMFNSYISVNIAEKGQSYVVSNDSPWAIVKVAEKQFVDITGIKFSGDKIYAAVEYTWKYGDLTPFAAGSGYDESSDFHSETAYFRLYDDGWRVE